MKAKKIVVRALPAACALVLMSTGNLTAAQEAYVAPAAPAAAKTPDAAAVKHVDDAAAVAKRMLEEPRMKEILAQAKGVFIVPTYGRAAIGIGASGGAGVLSVKRADGTWNDPLFYNMGGISAGAQVGVEGGSIAMVLNNEKAVNKFLQKNAFTLSADAGLTVVNWSKMAQGAVGNGDVLVWAGTKGLYGNLVSIGASDIRYNEKLTTAYYGHPVMVNEALAGKYSNPQADALKQTLTSGAVPAAAPPPR
jgi:lipid-binding SYLF domain-containing protein